MGDTPTQSGDERTYGGLPGAFPYAFAVSPSHLFRAYVVVSAVLGVLASVVVLAALARWITASTGAFGEQAFLLTVGLLVLAPMFAPVLLVARRHRRGRDDATGRYDRALALAGFGYVAAIWLGMAVAGAQPPQPGPFAPVVGLLYRAPGVLGLVPPLVGAAGVLLAHRRAR